MDNPAARVYEQGKMIPVDNDTIKSAIDRVVDQLGFERFYTEFSVVDPGDEYRKATRRRAGFIPSENTFQFAPEEHQAIITHEAVHYAMHNSGLFFPSRLDKEGFFGNLLNETIAEVCTTLVYGYKIPRRMETHIASADFWGWLAVIGVVRIREGKVYPEGVLDERDNFKDEDLHVPDTATGKETYLFPDTVYLTQRDIEKKFSQTGRIEGILADTEELLGFWPARQHRFVKQREFGQGVMKLATENSYNLTMNEVLPSRVRELYERQTLNGTSPIEVYYNSLLPLMRREET